MHFKAIHIFPHSGSQIPQEFLNREVSLEDLDLAMQANRDTGFEFVVEELKKIENHKVFYFPYSRAFCDINRLRLEHITPDKIFTGHVVPRLTRDEKQQIAEKYVFPYQQEILRTIQANPDAYIVHWHSMDSINKGIHTVPQAAASGSMRPILQLFSKIDCYKQEFVNYFDTQNIPELVNCNLLSSDMIKQLSNSLREVLNKNSLYKEKSEVTIDDPYVLSGEMNGQQISMPMLANMLHAAMNFPIDKHIAFDIRKDCLNQKSQLQILKALLKVINRFE